jgi:hypothetical protein
MDAMRRISLAAALFLGLVACGGDDGGNPAIDAPTGTPDSNVDAPPAPLMITLSGTANEQTAGGSNPVADALIEAYATSDETTPLATVMTNAEGEFSLTITTTGTAIAGYVKASKAGLKETYLYPPGPIAADLAGAPVTMLSQQNFNFLSAITQGNHEDGNAFIAVVVAQGTLPNLMPVAGATIETTPAATRYRYNMGGSPNSMATQTGTDGVAYAFNVAPGPLTVTANKTGTTFGTTSLKGWPDQITTTLVVQQ